MNRLNLDAFKAQVNETQELENLTGGILGACHCGGHDSDGSGYIDSFSEYVAYYACVLKGEGDLAH